MYIVIIKIHFLHVFTSCAVMVTNIYFLKGMGVDDIHIRIHIYIYMIVYVYMYTYMYGVVRIKYARTVFFEYLLYLMPSLLTSWLQGALSWHLRRYVQIEST